MDQTSNNASTRREFLKTSSRLAAVSALAGTAIPHAYAAAGSDTIQLALVGCGGRGTDAVVNALSVNKGPLKLVALADVFDNRLNASHGRLSKDFAAHMDVPPDRRFIGLESYKQAMDCLKPGDIVILGTPPAFRWVHFSYAVQKGLNVFMEKPVTVDGPTSRRMFALGEDASRKNLKVGVGLMSRHSRPLAELAKRLHDGEIGEIILQRGYRMHGPIGFFQSPPKPDGISHLMYQVQRFHSFLWASGGCYSDFYIHIIDHMGWMKNAWPVKAQALGGRHYRESSEGVLPVDQNFDTYAVEYTYADGTKFFFDGRCMGGCNDVYASFLHGSKGSGVASKSGDCGPPSSLYKDTNMQSLIWESKPIPGQEDPYLNEWADLLDAIRNDKPYNEVKRGVEASLITSMGRMAAHSGQEITYEHILNSDHEFAPGLDKLTSFDSQAPLQPDSDGRYPIPMPGRKKDREY